MKPFVFFGSARPNGDTRRALDLIIAERPMEFVDLSTLNITEFDYEGRNHGDDFFPLMERAIPYDTWILATPTYWYSMSGRMKIFMDRWTDLMYHRKDLCAQLTGKRLFVITAQGAFPPPRHFESPFWQTAKYFKMNYEGCYSLHTGRDGALKVESEEAVRPFQEAIFGQTR